MIEKLLSSIRDEARALMLMVAVLVVGGAAFGLVGSAALEDSLANLTAATKKLDGAARLVLTAFVLVPWVVTLLVSYQWMDGGYGSKRDRAKLAGLALEREKAFAALEPASPVKTVRETAIARYALELALELKRLRSRAMCAFAPGLALCLASLLGPWVAWKLAEQHQDWKFMIGGSTLAAVLLGAGTALLRHDNKMREQIQASQGELLYFSRIKAGLDCARSISEDEYQRGLRAVTIHLLAAPPSLAGVSPEIAKVKTSSGESEKPKEENGSGSPAEAAAEVAKEAVKAAFEAAKEKATH